MQDGFIFSDTIVNNIAVGAEKVDRHKLLKAVRMSNIQEFIEGLPMGYQTKIGQEGDRHQPGTEATDPDRTCHLQGSRFYFL